MNMRELTLAIGILGAGFLGGAYYGSQVFSDLERITLRERLEERRKERDEARAERDAAKKEVKDLHEKWERERRRPFREIDPSTTVRARDTSRFVDHSTWEDSLP